MGVPQQPQATAAEKDNRTAEDMAREKAAKRELALEEMRTLEAGDAPTTLAGWPSGPAQYLTYGSEDNQYGTGVTAKLGPPDVRHYADGSVSIGGKKVDNPDDYKGEPLDSSPSDRDTPS